VLLDQRLVPMANREANEQFLCGCKQRKVVHCRVLLNQRLFLAANRGANGQFPYVRVCMHVELLHCDLLQDQRRFPAQTDNFRMSVFTCKLERSIVVCGWIHAFFWLKQ